MCLRSTDQLIRLRANLPASMTPLLALYCHPNDPVAGTVLLPTQTIIVPICIRYINQPIAPIRLLSRPDQMIVPIRLRSTDRMIVPVRLRSTDRPTDWPIDELCVRPLSLPPLVPYYRPNRQRLCHCAYSRPNDRADTPAIPIMVVPISLRPNPVAGTVLLVLEYMEKGYMVTCLRMAVLHTKKELPVLEYMDRGYINMYLWLVILMVTYQPPPI